MFGSSTIASKGTTPFTDHVNQDVSISSEEMKFQILKSIPKYNSHCHLGGEIPIEILLGYANEEQAEAIKQAISELSFGKEYEKAFHIFPLITQIINTHDKLKEATYQTCQRFKLDNNKIVLLRTGLKLLENKTYEEYLNTVLKGVQKSKSLDEDFDVFLMLSLKRSSTQEMAQMTVDLAIKYQDKGIVGIDISDISTVGNIAQIVPELHKAKKSGLKIAVHMGESAREKDQLFILEELEPDLIDHGVNLCKEAKELIQKRNIPVTVCLTSSIAAKMHNDANLHPWIVEHLESGHPIDLGTDDSTVFGNISLSSEFYKLCSDLEFEKIVQIANESFNRSKFLFQNSK